MSIAFACASELGPCGNCPFCKSIENKEIFRCAICGKFSEFPAYPSVVEGKMLGVCRQCHEGDKVAVDGL